MKNKIYDNYSCKYILYNPQNLEQLLKEYEDIIFNNELNGLFDMINEIIDEKYKNIKYIKYFPEKRNNVIIKDIGNNIEILLLKNLREIHEEDNNHINIFNKKINKNNYEIKCIKIGDFKKLFIYDSIKGEIKKKVFIHFMIILIIIVILII